MKMLRNEKGFTLLELLIVIVILGAIMGVMSMAIIQIAKVSPGSNDWAIALRQVQNAGYWISRDVQMSEGNIDVNPDPATFLTLTLPQIPPPNETIVYQFESLNGEQWLTRTESTGGKTVIAQYISNTTANYDSDNCTLTFTIGATSGNVPVARDYEAMQRVPAP